MIRGVHVLVVSVTLSVSAVVGLLNWVTHDNPTESFLKQRISYSKNSKISDIDVEFENGQVFLNVHTTSPMTCLEVKRSLGIQALIIKNKTYIPNCTLESKSLIQLTYTKDNPV